MTRVIVGHLGDRRGIDRILPIAEKGVWLGIDNIGWSSYTRDDQRVENICALIDKGYSNRILLGMDICRNSDLSYYGGRGYGYLLDGFIPMLKAAGLGEIDITKLIEDNPKKALSFTWNK